MFQFARKKRRRRPKFCHTRFRVVGVTSSVKRQLDAAKQVLRTDNCPWPWVLTVVVTLENLRL